MVLKSNYNIKEPDLESCQMEGELLELSLGLKGWQAPRFKFPLQLNSTEGSKVPDAIADQPPPGVLGP